MLVPLITGVLAGLLAGGNALPIAPLSIAVLALFWLRTPVESWIGAAPVKARTPGEFRLVRRAALVLAAVSGTASVWLFWGGRNLAILWIGAAAGVALLAQAMVKRGGRDGREAAQMIGAAGLTAVAPAAWYVVTGHFHGAVWWLWVANFLFAANQIQFVQLRIRAAHVTTRSGKIFAGRWFLAAQAFLLVLLASGRLLPWYAALAFLPVLFRGFAWFVLPSKTLAIHALGKRELVYAGLFGVLLAGGFALRAV